MPFCLKTRFNPPCQGPAPLLRPAPLHCFLLMCTISRPPSVTRFTDKYTRGDGGQTPGFGRVYTRFCQWDGLWPSLSGLAVNPLKTPWSRPFYPFRYGYNGPEVQFREGKPLPQFGTNIQGSPLTLLPFLPLHFGHFYTRFDPFGQWSRNPGATGLGGPENGQKTTKMTIKHVKTVKNPLQNQLLLIPAIQGNGFCQ